MTEQEIFTTRLRRQRQRTRISLTEIATITHVKESVLEALERSDLSAWPRGLYARAYIRAYATAVGLDAESTVDEFCRLFPQGDRRARFTMSEIAAIVASESEWKDEFALVDGDRRLRARPQGRLAVATARVSGALRSAWAWGLLAMWSSARLSPSGRLSALRPGSPSRNSKAGV